MAIKKAKNSNPPAALIYDGECPFCSAYVRLMKLREAVGEVVLVNARLGGPLVDEVFRAGLDLDEGMVLKFEGHLYHGSDCMTRLALLTSTSSFFNRINAAIFRHRAISGFLYPILRAGRNITLFLLGRRRIGKHDRISS
ncbi:DCC1-like thiol-disulfide oxidoreductase family protein [Elongatibacter sediminis]|uniref:DCC1-like thiol-disulfide oxidoreductase family protein n=1 Tax=Elongatibacter sediminis TaxID=3119006 RepID=UPI00339DA7EC